MSCHCATVLHTGPVGCSNWKDESAQQGRKDDGGKLRWSLLPLSATREVVRVLMFGAKKYAPGNWRHVDNARERYYDATIRHLTSWWEGERNDPESGFHHLAHAGCCVFFALALELEDRVERRVEPRGEGKATT